MGNLNKALLIGRLGADPEVRFTPGGDPVCNMRIATSEKWTDKQGQAQERTEWHRVSIWGKPAEACGKYLHKGSQVFVEGQIQTRSWDKDGEKRYSTEIKARHVEFLDSKPKSADKPASDPSADRDDYGPPPSDEDIPF